MQYKNIVAKCYNENMIKKKATWFRTCQRACPKACIYTGHTKELRLSCTAVKKVVQ